jgi:DNA-binding XRE family transcriptional regulator
MDQEIKDILREARSKGATPEQLQQIADAYFESKKKNQSASGLKEPGTKTESMASPSRLGGERPSTRPTLASAAGKPEVQTPSESVRSGLKPTAGRQLETGEGIRGLTDAEKFKRAQEKAAERGLLLVTKEEAEKRKVESFANTGEFIGLRPATMLAGAATFVADLYDTSVSTITGGNVRPKTSEEIGKLAYALSQEEAELNKRILGEDVANKGLSQLYDEGNIEGAAKSAALGLSGLYLDILISRKVSNPFVKAYAPTGMKIPQTLNFTRAQFAKEIGKKAFDQGIRMFPLALKSAGYKIEEVQREQAQADVFDDLKTLGVGTVIGAVEVASEAMFRTSVDDLLINGFTKNFVSDLYKANKPILAAARGTAKETLTQSVQEGTEELAAGIADIVIDGTLYNKDMFTEANAFSLIDSFLLGSLFAGPTTLLSYGPSSVGKASSINARRKVIDDLNTSYDKLSDDSLSPLEKMEIKKGIETKLGMLAGIQKQDNDFYELFSEEDRMAALKANQKITMGQVLLSKIDDPDARFNIEQELKKAYSEKTKVESKYDPNIKVYEYVGQEGKPVPSAEQTGEAAVQAQPVQEAGTRTPETDRIFQALGQDETLGAMERGEEVYEDDAVAAQERILGLIDQVNSLNLPQEVKDQYIEVLGEKFEDLEYYDNKTTVSIEESTERRPVGAPKRVIRQKVGERASTGFPRLRNYERLNNSQVTTGTEAEGEVSVIEEQEDGTVALVSYKDGVKATSRPLANSLLDLEYVESVFDNNGTLTGVVMRPKTAKGQPESTETFTISNKPELAMDIAIQAKTEQVGSVAQADFEYAFEEVTTKKVVKKKMPVQERPAKTAKPAPVVQKKVNSPTKQDLNNLIESDPARAEVYSAMLTSMDLLQSYFPDAKFVITENDAETKAYLVENDPGYDDGNVDGQFFKNKNTDKIEILINKQRAKSPEVVFHEVFHAGFAKVYGQSVKKATEFMESLKKILNTGNAQERAIANKIDSFLNRGKYAEKDVPEEYLAEGAGILATNKAELSAGMVNKLKNFFNSIAKKLGINPVFTKAATTKEVVDFMNSFVAAARQGTSFKETQQDGKETKQPAAGNRLFNEPLKAVKSIADRYYQRAFGTERPTFKGTGTLDKDRAKRISDEFDAMKHSPNDPEVAKAYKALSEETIAQYEAFLDAGYVVEINNDEPYTNSQEMIDDLRKNKSIKIFSTESGFGDTPITEKQRKENPLLAKTKFKDVNGQPMLVNDLFRAVHDFYGHAELGNSFGPKGEENAWNVHARMFSPIARRAMTTETRGQNSYVNFSGINKEADKLREKARKLREEGKFDEALEITGQIYQLTSFADQKVGLLPEEFSQIEDFESISSKFDNSKRSFSKAELDELVNSKYTKEQIESMINSGTYSLMSAENPQAASTVEDNDERTARAEKWLKKNGYGDYTKIYGVFGNKENSFLVPDMTMEAAEAFRKEFDQESVAHSDGYISKKGVNPRDREGNEFGIDYTDPKSNNYSIVKDSDGNVISFRTDYNFAKIKTLVGDVGTIYESDKLSLKSKSRGEFSVSERFETADINELNNYKSGRIYSTKWTGSAKAAESIEKKLLNEGFEVNVKVASTNSRYIEFYRESDQKEGVIRVSGHGRIGDITLDTRTREAVSKTGKPYEFKEVFFTVNSDIDFDNDFFEANVMTSKSFEATKEALDNFISAPKSKSSREWVEDVQLEVRAKLQDRMVRVLKIQEDIQSYIGGTVPLNFDFKNAEARLPGVVRDLQDKTMEKAEEIIKLFSSEGLNPEQFGDLLYALHAQERNKAVRIRTTDVPMSLRTLRNMFDLTPTQAAKNAGVSVDVYKSIEAGGTFTEQELNDIVDSYGMTTDEFFREFTRNNEGSGMSDLEAREILSNYGVKNLDNPLASMLPAKLAKAVSMSHEINQQTRGLLVSSGLETREIVDAYEYAYDNYVPLRGFVPEEDGDEVEVFVEGGKRLPVRGKIKRAMGRYSKSDDPFTQLIAQNFNVIARAKKNEAMQKLYNLTDDVKNPEVYKAVNTSRDVKYKEQFINGKQVRVPVPPRDYANNPNYVPVRFNGIDRFIKFEDPRMVEALNGMNVQQTNAIFSVFKTINRAMTATITVYDPEFVLRNFSRDIQMSLINVMAEQELVDGLAAGEKIIGNTMKGVPKSFKAIFDAQRGNENTTKYAKYYNEFLEDGGQIETFYGSTSKEVGESVKSLFDKENRDQSGRLVRLKESTMKASFGLIKDINSSVENAIRLSAYIAAREAGVSREKAAELGKKVTVDFNRTGEYGQFMNSLYLFFNASIQGSSRLIRTLKPVKVDGKLVVTRPQKIALGLMAFAGILSLVNAAISGDDEEDGKSWYSKIPDYEKERNMIFMNPFDKQGKDYFKIPLPYGLNIFYVLGNSIADVSLGENKLAEAFTNVALSIVSNFSPIGFPTSENPEKRLLKMITPSVFQPIAGIALNEDFTGRPVYSENLPFDKTPLPDSELGKKAGPAATNLAKTLNEATGGSQVRSGSTDVNPDVLEYILNYYTGGVGKTSSRVGKLAYAGINGELKDVKPNDIPLARVFYGTAYDRVDYTGFYKKISNVYQLNEEIKLGLRSGSEAKKIQVTLAEAKAVDKRLRNIRKAEKEGRINEDKAEDMRTDLMKNFLRDYDKRKIDDI